MKLLGVDYGQRRIGLAVGEEFASPLKTLWFGKNKDAEDEAIEQIARVCVTNGVKKVIVGIPYDRTGKEGMAAKRVRKFGQRLSTRLKAKVDYFDESLSSKDALQVMIDGGASQKDRRNKLDAVAAALILQGYINAQEERKEKRD